VKQKWSKRQKAASVLAIIITVMLVLSMLTPYLSYFIYGATINAKETENTSQAYTFEEDEFSNGGFEVYIAAGKNGVCFSDIENPIEVTLKSDADFSGWLVLKIPTGRNVPEGKKSNFVTYSYEISLNKNEEKKILAEKYLNADIPALVAELKDQTGVEVFSKNIDIIFSTSEKYTDTYYTGTQNPLPVSNTDKFMAYTNNYSGTIPFLGGGRMWGIFMVIGIYAVLVSFLYFILKKRDKCEKAWVIIPALSLCAALAVYLLSIGSSYKQNIMNTVNIIIEENGNEEASLFSNTCIISPEGGDILLELDENKDFGFDFYDYRDKNNGLLRAFVLSGAGYSNAVFYDTNPWDKNYLFYRKAIESCGILTDIDIDGSIVKGSITNGGEKEFSDVILVIGREVCRIGDFKPGDVFDVNVDIYSDEYLDYFYYGMMSEEAFPEVSNKWDARKLIETGGETEYGIYEKNIRKEFLENSLSYSYSNNQGSFKMPVMLFAFGSGSFSSKTSMVNMKEPITMSQDMYFMDLSIDLSGHKNYYLPFGFISPSLITIDGKTTEYYPKDNLYFYTLNGGIAEISFNLLPASGIKSINIKWEDIKEIYAFNCKTETWEKVSGSLNADYLSKEGILKLKAEVSPDIDMIVPAISVEGGL